MTHGAATSVLVARTHELAQLDAALGQVRAGRPSTVLIGGEAGVGKSRLAGEFATRAKAAGAVRVLYGYCLGLSAEGLPFAPFTGMLRELVRELGADGLAALLPGQGTRDLARLLPELGEPDVQGDPGEARARLFEEVLSALASPAMRNANSLTRRDLPTPASPPMSTADGRPARTCARAASSAASSCVRPTSTEVAGALVTTP